MKHEEIECFCGCGGKINKYDRRGRIRKYIVGHSMKGKAMIFKNQEERILNLKKSLTGRTLSEETKIKISLGGTGKKKPGTSEKLLGNKYALKDGWYRHRGYIYVHYETDLNGRRKYRAEHVLIVEEVIGRRLKKRGDCTSYKWYC